MMGGLWVQGNGLDWIEWGIVRTSMGKVWKDVEGTTCGEGTSVQE